MARSGDKLNANHKMVFVLKSLVQRQDQRTPISCRVCEQVFFDKKTLMNHFQTHFHPDGTFNPNSLIRIFAPPENEIRYNTNISHSSSVPMNTRKSIANENLGLYARQTVASNPSKLSLGNSLVSPPSKKPVQLTFRHQPYPSSSIIRSAMNHIASGSRPNGPQNISLPSGPNTPAIINPKIMNGSNFCFPMEQSSFSPPVTVSKPSQSVAGTSGLGRGKHSQSAMKHVVVDPLVVATKPYINQLEHSIEEMTAGHNDAGGDELDLTLKL